MLIPIVRQTWQRLRGVNIFIRTCYPHYHTVLPSLSWSGVRLQDDQLPALHGVAMLVWAVINSRVKTSQAPVEVPKIDTQCRPPKEIPSPFVVALIRYSSRCHPYSSWRRILSLSKLTYRTPADGNPVVFLPTESPADDSIPHCEPLIAIRSPSLRSFYSRNACGRRNCLGDVAFPLLTSVGHWPINGQCNSSGTMPRATPVSPIAGSISAYALRAFFDDGRGVDRDRPLGLRGVTGDSALLGTIEGRGLRADLHGARLSHPHHFGSQGQQEGDPRV